jgi:ATPase subunit of ABC transporter with duplicated ATPase domains
MFPLMPRLMLLGRSPWIRKGIDSMRRWVFAVLLAGVLSFFFATGYASDEQRQAYDKMVEESVKEADEYVRKKQQEASDRHAQKQREKEAAKMETADEEEEKQPGVHTRRPPVNPEGGAVATPLPAGSSSPGSN